MDDTRLTNRVTYRHHRPYIVGVVELYYTVIRHSFKLHLPRYFNTQQVEAMGKDMTDAL